MKLTAKNLLQDAVTEFPPEAKTAAFIAEMKQRKLLSLFRPLVIDGRGHSVATACELVMEVAEQDGSIGLLYAMHLSQLASLCYHAPSTPYFDALINEALSNQYLIASCSSEIGTQGNVLKSICSVSESGESGKVTKRCSNVSYFDLADLFLITANNRGEQSLIACQKRGVVVSSSTPRQFFGMGGISNGQYDIEGTFPMHAVFPEPFAQISRNTMTPVIYVLWAAAWTGIATRAIAVLKLSANKDRSDKVLWAGVTHLCNKLYLLRSILRDCANAFDVNTKTERRGIGNFTKYSRLKLLASELAPEICIGSLNLVGIGAYSKGSDVYLGDCIADVLSAPVMISNSGIVADVSEFEPFSAMD